MKITPNVPTGAFTLKPQATWNVLFDDNNKAVAIFSTKSRLADVAMAGPEMYELIMQVADLHNPRFDGAAYIELVTEMDRLADLAQELLAKIEGGGE